MIFFVTQTLLSKHYSLQCHVTWYDFVSCHAVHVCSCVALNKNQLFSTYCHRGCCRCCLATAVALAAIDGVVTVAAVADVAAVAAARSNIRETGTSKSNFQRFFHLSASLPLDSIHSHGNQLQIKLVPFFYGFVNLILVETQAAARCCVC